MTDKEILDEPLSQKKRWELDSLKLREYLQATEIKLERVDIASSPEAFVTEWQQPPAI